MIARHLRLAGKIVFDDLSCGKSARGSTVADTKRSASCYRALQAKGRLELGTLMLEADKEELASLIQKKLGQ